MHLTNKSNEADYMRGVDSCDPVKGPREKDPAQKSHDSIQRWEQEGIDTRIHR